MHRRWRDRVEILRGHCYFTEYHYEGPEAGNKTGRVAVVDRSGFYPDQTEDGILYLNYNGYLVMQDGGCGISFHIPLIYPVIRGGPSLGREISTLGNLAEVIYLAKTYRMTVVLGDAEFKYHGLHVTEEKKTETATKVLHEPT